MKVTGIVRQPDSVGRLVIPIEMRRMHGIKPGDCLEFFIDGDQLVLRKYERGCLFCGSSKGITVFKNKIVCNRCLSMAADKITGGKTGKR